MCNHETRFTRASLLRCNCGTFHLTLGSLTLHLSEDELVLLSQVIRRTTDRHPLLRARIDAGFQDGYSFDPGQTELIEEEDH